MTEVRIPDDLWDDDSEGAISAWLYEDGDQVEAGAVIAEVMNEKVASELLAPASGALIILTAAEEPVRKGQVVARIDP
jgi:pyruvate/2-oxoglutarate dehydrogenase complex dihydrolipoamide acyltransferase (E2) component